MKFDERLTLHLQQMLKHAQSRHPYSCTYSRKFLPEGETLAEGCYTTAVFNIDETCVVRDTVYDTLSFYSRQQLSETIANLNLVDLAGHTTMSNSGQIETTCVQLYSTHAQKPRKDFYTQIIRLVHGYGGDDLSWMFEPYSCEDQSSLSNKPLLSTKSSARADADSSSSAATKSSARADADSSSSAATKSSARTQHKKLSDIEKLDIVYDIAQNLALLHDGVGAVHGDIKFNNIVRNSSGYSSLIDYNLCRVGLLRNGTVFASTNQTHYNAAFRSPEMFRASFDESECSESSLTDWTDSSDSSDSMNTSSENELSRCEDEDATNHEPIHYKQDFLDEDSIGPEDELIDAYPKGYSHLGYHGPPLTSKSDIWALGMLVCTLVREDVEPFCSSVPIDNQEEWEATQRMKSDLLIQITGDHESRGLKILALAENEFSDPTGYLESVKYRNVHPQLLKIMSMCLQENPMDRPRALEILPRRSQRVKIRNEIKAWKNHRAMHFQALTRRAWRIGSCFDQSIDFEKLFETFTNNSVYSKHALLIFNTFVGIWVCEYGDYGGFCGDDDMMCMIAAACLVMTTTVLGDECNVCIESLSLKMTGRPISPFFTKNLLLAGKLVCCVVPSLAF